jgi:predicted AlkP superfamily phosphohydrolase/phosphomutase
VDLLPDGCFAHGLVEFGFVQAESHTAADWRARPLWDIIGDYGLVVGVVRWPVTYPAQAVRGFLVTDQFHLVADSPIPPDLEQAVYPADLLPLARSVYAVTATGGLPGILPADGPVASVAEGPPGARPERWDRTYGAIAERALDRFDVNFLAVRYQGLDTTGHWYLRYAEPRAFGDVTEAERADFGQVLDRYYAFVDGQVGRAIAVLRPDDLLLVVSGFGMQPVTPGKRLLARVLGGPDLSGTHEEAPDGFLLAYGAHVVKGKLERGSLVDVAPTVLYYLGLPVGRDMDGFARADLFSRTFTASHPITFIPSHQR